MVAFPARFFCRKHFGCREFFNKPLASSDQLWYNIEKQRWFLL